LIGAGSTVTKNTNPKGIYIGVPAKYIKDVEKDELL
jgi:acetyltransferase-like isoleucine patch superfamily enzyme